MLFKNRQDTGKWLAKKLKQYKGKSSDTIVLGLPRGGIIVAAEIAQELQLPLDVIITRKIGAPGNPEFAIGAITEEGEAVLNDLIIDSYEISAEYIAKELEKEKQEIIRRKSLYRANRPELNLQGKTALLVDDGIGTGYTIRAGIVSARAKGAKKVIVAIPVVAADTIPDIRIAADEVVSLYTPAFLGSVGSFYKEFNQVSDAEVISLMKKSL